MYITGIGIYLGLAVAFGWYNSRKKLSQAQFFVSNRDAGFLQLSGSLLATILGSSAILGTVDLAVEHGWAAAWFLIAGAIGLLLLRPIIPGLIAKRRYTLPELLGDFYGERVKKLAMLIIPIAWTGIVSAQMIGAARILTVFTSLGYSSSLLLASVVFILYTMLGGQNSVIKTDFLQAILVLAGVIIMLIIGLNHLDNSIVAQAEYAFPTNSSFGVLDVLLILFSYAPTYIAGPDIASRIFCAKNERVAQKATLLVALLILLISFILGFLGIWAANTFSPDQLSSQSALVLLVEQYLPSGLALIVVLGLISVVLSSADTTLLTSASIASDWISGGLNRDTAVRDTRIFIAILGMLSIIISLYINSIISALLFALAVYSGAFVVPVIAGVMGYRFSASRVIWAISTGGIVALSGKVLQMSGEDLGGKILVISSMLVNALILFFPSLSKKNGTS